MSGFRFTALHAALLGTLCIAAALRGNGSPRCMSPLMEGQQQYGQVLLTLQGYPDQGNPEVYWRFAESNQAEKQILKGDLHDVPHKAGSKTIVRYQFLRSDIRIRCKGKGKATVYWAGAPMPVATTPTLIPYLAASVDREYLQAYTQLLRPAGSLRSGNRVYWPAKPDDRDYCTVLPETLTFCWFPLPAGTRIDLRIEAVSNTPENPIWQATNLDGASGKLTSPEARAKLRQWQTQQGEQPGEATFVLKMPNRTFEVPIQVMTASQTKQLNKELAWWDRHAHKTALYLGRAAVYDAQGLLAEAAAEYEAALALAPHDTLLRARTAQAYRMLGNEHYAVQIEIGSHASKH